MKITTANKMDMFPVCYKFCDFNLGNFGINNAGYMYTFACAFTFQDLSIP
jgi:hypothetical protein